MNLHFGFYKIPAFLDQMSECHFCRKALLREGLLLVFWGAYLEFCMGCYGTFCKSLLRETTFCCIKYILRCKLLCCFRNVISSITTYLCPTDSCQGMYSSHLRYLDTEFELVTSVPFSKCSLYLFVSEAVLTFTFWIDFCQSVAILYSSIRTGDTCVVI